MIERYELNQSKLPTIPAPHDAVIVKFGVADEFLVLYFEDNISHRDSVKYDHPNANTLIMKFLRVRQLRNYPFVQDVVRVFS